MQEPFSPTKTFFLFAALILAWGLSWPISKIGLMYMSPLWFTASRLIIGSLIMLLILITIKKFIWPKKQDIPLLISVAIFQIGAYLLLVNYGLANVYAGRAAIITYTTPLWVTPISVLFFKEKLIALKVLGLFLGFIGVLMLFNPWSIDWGDKQFLFGNLILLVASLFWSIAILHTRFGTWHSPVLSLFFWQLLLASIFVLLVCIVVEPKPLIQWNLELINSILYSGIIATAFGFWGSIELSRRLSPITMSLTFLLVPVLGLIISAIYLNEPITLNLMIAMLIILLGISLVVAGDWQIKK